MKNYKKNLKILEDGHVYSKEMEHDACGVGLIASTEGKKSRKVVEYGINALKAVWHRGAVDALASGYCSLNFSERLTSRLPSAPFSTMIGSLESIRILLFVNFFR